VHVTYANLQACKLRTILPRLHLGETDSRCLQKSVSFQSVQCAILEVSAARCLGRSSCITTKGLLSLVNKAPRNNILDIKAYHIDKELNYMRMASSTTESSDASGARTLPTPDELSQAFAVEVYDRKGKTKTLGELVKGQKSVLVFIRHFCKFDEGVEYMPAASPRMKLYFICNRLPDSIK
jgi:hypothetical protein